MISVGDAVLKLGIDKAGFEQSMQQAEQSATSSLERMSGKLRGMGAAFTAVGAAGVKMISDARKLNATLGQTALTTGIAEGELRNMALSISNVTFPLKEAVATMDLLARAGVRDQDTLAKTATAFDTLGDAIGSTASVVADQMIMAMKTYGLTAEQTAASTDKITYLIRNSALSMDNLASVIGYITPELVEMGLTLDDTIALLGIMESKGVSGAVATRAFRSAITEATNEGISLAEALGVTTEEMEAYKVQLEGTEGLTQQFADQANRQYGVLDRLKALWERLSFTLGSVMQPLEPIMAVMTAMGPVMIFLSTGIGRSAVAWLAHAAAVAKNSASAALGIGTTTGLTAATVGQTAATGAATTATHAFNAALRANPIILIISGIVALVFAIRHLINHWDEASHSFEKNWAKMKNAALTAVDAIAGVWQKMTEKVLPDLSEKIGVVREGFSTMIDANKVRLDALAVEAEWIELRKSVKQNYDTMMQEAQTATESAISSAKTVAEQERQTIENRRQYYRDMTYERLELIDEQMMAELRAMDPQLAATVDRYNRQIEAINEEGEARDRVLEEDRKRELEQELLADDLTEEKRRQLEDQIADIQDRWSKERIIEQRNLAISQADYQSYFDQRQTLVEQELQIKIDAYNADLMALKELDYQKLEEVRDFVRKYNEILANAGMTSQYTVPETAVPEERIRPTNPITFFQYLGKVITGAPGYQYGGTIDEPTALIGMRTGKIRKAGEAGREWLVSPEGAGITNNFNGPWYIREEADIYKLARELYNLQRTKGRQLGIG